MARPQNRESKIFVPGIGDTTHHQLTTLLSAASSMIPFIVEGAIRVGPDQTSPALDGGVVCAATSSVIRTFNRIDQILDDDRRWNIDGIIANHDAVTESIKTQKKLLESQLAHLSRPSTKMGPKLGRTPSGTWVAILEPPDNSFAPIYGVGADPDSALRDFDRAFNATMEVMAAVASQPDPAPESASAGSSDPQPREPMERLHRTADEKKGRRPRKEKPDDTKE